MTSYLRKADIVDEMSEKTICMKIIELLYFSSTKTNSFIFLWVAKCDVIL